MCLQATADHDEAIDVLLRALSIDPDCVEALEKLGVSYVARMRYADAIAVRERGLRLAPDRHDITHNLAISYGGAGRLAEAERYHRRALYLCPDNALFLYTFWNLLLMPGDIAGWEVYERWMHVGRFKYREFPKLRWDGDANAAGSLLVYVDHGFGDAILMFRFFPTVKDRFGGKLLLECRPEMTSLMANERSVDAIVTRRIDGLAPDTPFDAVTGLMSLPGLLCRTYDEIPASVPYVSPPNESFEYWADRLSEVEGLRVGVCWTGFSGNRGMRCAPVRFRSSRLSR